MINLGASWYLVITKPRMELTAQYNLKNQNFDVFLPLERSCADSEKRGVSARPVFSRHLFVGVDRLRRNWSAVRGTIGVDKIFCAGRNPAPVSVSALGDLYRAVNGSETGNSALSVAPSDRMGSISDMITLPMSERVGRLYQLLFR